MESPSNFPTFETQTLLICTLNAFHFRAALNCSKSAAATPTSIYLPATRGSLNSRAPRHTSRACSPMVQLSDLATQSPATR